MLRFWIDLVACMLQGYITAAIVCRIFIVKKPLSRSYFLAFLQVMVSYFVVNYVFMETPAQRIISGTIINILIGFFYFEGRRAKQVLSGIAQYMMFLMMDLSLQFFLFPSFTEVIMKLPPLEQKVIGRNLATAALFLIYTVVEMFAQRKEGTQKAGIMALAVTFGVVQLEILEVLAMSNPEKVVESRLFITAIFSVIMMGGFLLVHEMYKLMLNQQRKKAELEQIALEKMYQYDYYKKAFVQGERIRDIRHDMRNQLQTVEYLLCSESEEDRRRAEEMVEVLLEKAGGIC